MRTCVLHEERLYSIHLTAGTALLPGAPAPLEFPHFVLQKFSWIHLKQVIGATECIFRAYISFL